MTTARNVLSMELGIDVNRVDDSAEFPLGTTVCGDLGSEFVYVEADDAIAAGYVCQIANDWGAEEITNTNGAYGRHVGVAPVAIASGKYGWLQRAGKCDAIQAAANCAANAPVTTTTTAGELDDAAGAGTKNISGIALEAAVGGAAATAVGVLDRPVVTSTN